MIARTLGTTDRASRMPAVTWKSGASAPRKASRKNPGFSPRRRSFSTSLVHLLATILALALPAAAKSWRVSNFQDTITVNADGGALVTETITLNFVGEWHGITRSIPIE